MKQKRTNFKITESQFERLIESVIGRNVISEMNFGDGDLSLDDPNSDDVSFYTSNLNETDFQIEEGNLFSGERCKAGCRGEMNFTVDGVEYPLKSWSEQDYEDCGC